MSPRLIIPNSVSKAERREALDNARRNLASLRESLRLAKAIKSLCAYRTLKAAVAKAEEMVEAWEGVQ